MVDRTVHPPIREIQNLKLPEFQQTTLSGGIPLGLVAQSGHPIIIFNLIVPSGALQETMAGINYFAAKMLSEGTSKLNAFQIASKIDFYGGQLEISPSPDYVSIKLYTLKKYFPELLSLLIDLLSDSQFPEKEFDILKQIRIQHIRQQLAKNNVVAGLQFRKCLFGENHPYGRIIDEPEVKSVTLEKVFEYYKHGFIRKPRIYLAGDVDETEVKLIDHAFSKISFHPASEEKVPKPETTENIHIDKPGSLQTSIRLGSITLNRKHPDHLALRVANELLGGFFGSRLMKNIREEKGLTYGIYSSFIHFNQLSFWQIGTDVLKEKKDEAVDEILNEIRILQTQPPTQEELQTLKNYMKGKIKSSFDNVIDSLEIIRMLDLSGLTINYWSALFDEIDHISAEEISSISAKYFDPDKIRQVTVG